MELWQEKLQDIVEAMGGDEENAVKSILWCIGTLNYFKELGIVSEGGYEMSGKGQVIYEGLKDSFKPTDQQIASAIVGLGQDEDEETLALLLSTYRDEGDTMINDFKKFSEAYKYN